MNFITPDNVVLSNITNQRNVILTAERVTYVTKINVTNLSEDNSGIRITLKIVKTLGVQNPVEGFLVPYLLFEKNLSKDLVNILGEPILLTNGDSLIIYSGGWSQVFDCVANFYEVNEVVDCVNC